MATKPSGAWIPITPRGSKLTALARNSEASAWRALMFDMGVHKGRSVYESVGYKVVWEPEFELNNNLRRPEDAELERSRQEDC